MLRFPTHFWIPILLALVCAPAQAYERISFEAEFGWRETTLKDDTLLDVDSLGIRYTEHYNTPFRLELLLGHVIVDHHHDPSSAGFHPNGYYAGINAVLEYELGPFIGIGGSLGYRYHWASHAQAQQQFELDWRNAEARLWLGVKPTREITLYGCAVIVDIKIEQHIIATTASRRDFENKQDSGYCGGLPDRVGAQRAVSARLREPAIPAPRCVGRLHL